MKVDTKKCTPIKAAPEEAMIRPNKYILECENENNETKATSTPGGREKKYMAALIYSPVLTSTRESGKKNGRRLLTTADVDDLTQHLEGLFVSCKDDGEDGDEKVVSSKVKVINTKVKVEEGKESDRDVLLGRVAEEFVSCKDNGEDGDKNVVSCKVNVINTKVKVEEGKESDQDVLLGRVAEKFYSPKTRMSMSVLRSARKVDK